MIDEIINAINELLKTKCRVLVAIDGRCASGKTTLAANLSRHMDCTVLHMDDFFPQPHQRTFERLSQPGGNVDYERFEDEILIPIISGDKILDYRVYDCQSQIILPAVKVKIAPVAIVEGSYSCHPRLFDYYDLRVFLSVSEKTQLQRLEKRSPQKMDDFLRRWIPLEELYFEKTSVPQKCDLVFETDELF